MFIFEDFEKPEEESKQEEKVTTKQAQQSRLEAKEKEL